MEDDMVYESEAERNADPCTSRNCKWDQASNGMVYVPYLIADHYSECRVVEETFTSLTLNKKETRNKKRELLTDRYTFSLQRARHH